MTEVQRPNSEGGVWGSYVAYLAALEKELRDRELHHFETEQENAQLRAEIDRLRTVRDGV